MLALPGPLPSARPLVPSARPLAEAELARAAAQREQLQEGARLAEAASARSQVLRTAPVLHRLPAPLFGGSNTGHKQLGP